MTTPLSQDPSRQVPLSGTSPSDGQPPPADRPPVDTAPNAARSNAESSEASPTPAWPSANWPRAHGTMVGAGVLRTVNADFCVAENLGASPSGMGQHVWLHLENDGDNTAWIAGALAGAAGIAVKDVGYCGLKDRRALTRQWFSIDLAGRPMPDWRTLPPSISVLMASRATAKLRRGVHDGNTFVIRIREFRGSATALEERVRRIAGVGVPNYFGEQRFGYALGNLTLATNVLSGRKGRHSRPQRSIALSAARSWMFNDILAERVRTHRWQNVLVGEQAVGDSPGAGLYGRGRIEGMGMGASIERAAFARYRQWTEGLERVGAHMERRALVCKPIGLQASIRDEIATLQFSLARGQYATAVLREIIDYNDISRVVATA